MSNPVNRSAVEKPELSLQTTSTSSAPQVGTLNSKVVTATGGEVTKSRSVMHSPYAKIAVGFGFGALALIVAGVCGAAWPVIAVLGAVLALATIGALVSTKFNELKQLKIAQLTSNIPLAASFPVPPALKFDVTTGAPYLEKGKIAVLTIPTVLSQASIVVKSLLALEKTHKEGNNTTADKKVVKRELEKLQDAYVTTIVKEGREVADNLILAAVPFGKAEISYHSTDNNDTSFDLVDLMMNGDLDNLTGIGAGINQGLKDKIAQAVVDKFEQSMQANPIFDVEAKMMVMAANSKVNFELVQTKLASMYTDRQDEIAHFAARDIIEAVENGSIKDQDIDEAVFSLADTLIGFGCLSEENKGIFRSAVHQRMENYISEKEAKIAAAEAVKRAELVSNLNGELAQLNEKQVQILHDIITNNNNMLKGLKFIESASKGEEIDPVKDSFGNVFVTEAKTALDELKKAGEFLIKTADENLVGLNAELALVEKQIQAQTENLKLNGAEVPKSNPVVRSLISQIAKLETKLEMLKLKVKEPVADVDVQPLDNAAQDAEQEEAPVAAPVQPQPKPQGWLSGLGSLGSSLAAAAKQILVASDPRLKGLQAVADEEQN